MATRKIIRIDEDKCDGCGNCTTGCAEGALAIVDGKARLVKEQFCDGFGDCIGTCPTGALTIEERDAEEFDIDATRRHLLDTQGEDAVRRMEQANEAHEDKPPAAPSPAAPSGCPGMRMRAPQKEAAASAAAATGSAAPGHAIASDLDQWPVQLHLVQPGAPFFKGRELVVVSTCAPVASADVHWRFVRGRGIVVACPKLDNTEPYAAKLGSILADESIPKVIVLRMEVPCCGGLTMIARQAAELSGRTDLVVEEVTVGLNGDILRTQTL
jgi:Fe-S-cluster-containing hydrogenase component 2